MTEPVSITHFSAGDTVPGWLAVCDPMTPDAVLGKFTFLQRCVLLDRPYHRMVVGIDDPAGNLFALADCKDLKIMANGKPLLLAGVRSIWLPE